jgi:hypothetical protein
MILEFNIYYGEVPVVKSVLVPQLERSQRQALDVFVRSLLHRDDPLPTSPVVWNGYVVFVSLSVKSGLLFVVVADSGTPDQTIIKHLEHFKNVFVKKWVETTGEIYVRDQSIWKTASEMYRSLSDAAQKRGNSEESEEFDRRTKTLITMTRA